MSKEFDWNTNEAVVAKTQMGIAVYENTTGEAVIRQERDFSEETDSVVVVDIARLPDLIEALQKLLPERNE